MLELPSTKQISLTGVFLGLHNLFHGDSHADKDQVGATSTMQTYLTERKYLEYAISLAERDAR